MAHRLADLLGNNHPLFSYNLMRLEKASGNSGIDTRLLAEITEKAYQLIRELGLDGGYASVEEIYHALNALAPDARASLLQNAQYVLFKKDDAIVSFNLADVSANAEPNTSFADRNLENAKRALRTEILKRYMDSDRTDNVLVRRLIEEAGIPLEVGDSAVSGAESSKPDYNQPNKEDSSMPKILCVGDIITDAFIKLSEEFTKSYKDDNGYTMLSMQLGAKLPYDEVEIVKAVECSPNAAVSLSRLGLEADLMTWIGDDKTGEEMIEYLRGQGVGTDNIVVEAGMKSNYHYVLRYGADRTKLQKFEDFSYRWKDPATTPNWLYLGVLGEKTAPLHEAILDYLTRNPDVKLAFQPGMYHLMWGIEKMAPFYQRSEITIMNREEAAQVTGRELSDIKALLQGLHDLGVTVAVVTDGPAGAYASDGNKTLFMPNYPDPQPPLDRTGAGDAFASTIVAALALGNSLETALEWAPINSMSVVQQMGAQAGLLDKGSLENYFANAPEDYRPKEI